MRADLLVNSGVFDLFADGTQTGFDDRGLPALRIDDEALTDEVAADLLRVSAFAREGEPEHVVAERLFASQPGVSVHPVVGYHVGLYAGAVSDPDARAVSSSGGLTTWILLALFESGRIDGVIHVKKGAPESPQLFGYAVSRTAREIREGAKTRYYPGVLGECLRVAAQSGLRFAVVGIPSVLYEVRLAANLRTDIATSITHYVGLVCGHQKSTHYADALAWQVGIPPGHLRDVDFRIKLDGARASAYGVALTGTDENGGDIRAVRSASELYGTDWGLGFFKANYSDMTDDVFNETADIVLGDAWLPPYLSDSRGTNIVVARTLELNDLLLSGVRRGEIELDPLSVEQITQSQSGLVRHGRTLLRARRAYMSRKSEYLPAPRFPDLPRVDPVRSRVQQLRVRMARASHPEFMSAVQAKDFSVFEKRMRPLVREYRFVYAAASKIATIRRIASGSR